MNSAANIAGATVTVNDDRLVVNIPVGVVVGDGFVDSPAARTLGLFGSNVRVLDEVAAAETIPQALTRIEGADNSFYFVVPDAGIAAVEADALAVANWVAARPRYHGFVDLAGLDVLVANEATSIGAQLSALQQKNVAGIYNGGSIDHKALAYAGVFSHVNFEQPNSIITGKFKTLRGTTANVLPPEARAELTRKRINYYVQRGQLADTEEGTNFTTWIDVTFWLAWFQNAVQVAVYNQLRAGRNPQTEPGVSAIVEAIQGIGEQGVRNGGIAPNQVTPQTRQDIIDATGNVQFDGYLAAGYFIHSGAVSEQSQANREARKSPPITVWAKGSGAIHSVDIAIRFEE